MSVEPAVGGENRRFELVDALRGCAALAVVLPHALGLFIYPHESWFTSLFLRLADYARSSVQVFFVISGFAIAYSLREPATGAFSLPRFMLRRAVRLDPPYWVGLLWNGLMLATRRATNHQHIVLPELGKVVAHVFYLQDILGFGQFGVVFWTLCLEFQLYFSFAAMMRCTRYLPDPSRNAHQTFWSETDSYGWLMVGGFGVSLMLSHTVWPMRQTWFVPFFYLFLSGSLAAWLTLGRISDRVFRICLGAMGLGLLFRPELPRMMGFLALLILYVAIRRRALHYRLGGRAVQWVGRISYSIYLVHAPLARFFLGLRTRIAPDSKLASLIGLAVLYIFTIALASLLYVTVEAPCIRLSQLLKRSRSQDAADIQQAPLA